MNALKIERVSVVEDIKRAMADKDFRENAPLDAAKDQQGIVELRIRELEASINNAQILPEGSLHPACQVTSRAPPQILRVLR